MDAMLSRARAYFGAFPAVGPRKHATLAAIVLLTFAGCGRETPPAPVDSPAPPPIAEAAPEHVHAFCGACHAYPPPEQTAPGRFVRHSLEAGACDHVTCALGAWDGDGRVHLATGNFCLTERHRIAKTLTLWKHGGPRPK